MSERYRIKIEIAAEDFLKARNRAAWILDNIVAADRFEAITQGAGGGGGGEGWSVIVEREREAQERAELARLKAKYETPE